MAFYYISNSLAMTMRTRWSSTSRACEQAAAIRHAVATLFIFRGIPPEASCRTVTAAWVKISPRGFHRIQVAFHVLPGFRCRQGPQMEPHVDPPCNSLMNLQFQPLFQFGLPREDEGEGAVRIHLEVQEEADFFEHLP